MKLLIVIVNYDGFDLTAACLDSVAEQIGEVPGARVVLCENGSREDSAARLCRLMTERGWGDWLDLTAIHPNRGFTGGNNAVIDEAFHAPEPPAYVLLLNNDTRLRPHALATLVTFMDEHTSVGIAGSRLEDPDGTGQISAFRFLNVFSEFDRGLRLGIVTRLLRRHIMTPPIPADSGPTDWVAGASMIVRREVIEQIGSLDEGYYTYFDDIDYCRMAHDAGWPTWYVPQSRVIHLVGKTTGVTDKTAAARVQRRPGYWFAARRRYLLKHHSRLYAALADAAFLIGFTLWRVRRRIQRLADLDPEHLLFDSFRQSVFVQGFKVPVVENPAFKRPS